MALRCRQRRRSQITASPEYSPTPASRLGLTWSNVGRWNSRDPLGEGTSQTFNLYAYAESSPLVYADPSGEFSILPWLLQQPSQPSLGMCPAPNNLKDLAGPLFNQEYDDYPGNKPWQIPLNRFLLAMRIHPLNRAGSEPIPARVCTYAIL